MGQWGNLDEASNSVLWATTYVNLPANTTNQTALFDNTTLSAWNNNGVPMQKEVGQFGLDVAELNAIANAGIAQFIITNSGSGYSANPTVTVANTSGGANTTIANTTQTLGRVTAVTLVSTPGGYTTAPAVTIAAPTAQNITANTLGVVAASDFIKITTANSIYAVGDRVYYGVSAGNTAITPLTGNSYYYVSFANTTGITLATTRNGANIDITDTRTTTPAETHTFIGDTATANSVMRGVQHGAAHTGWVLRTVGQGGRAGRVQYETLVAMGGNLLSDAADDVVHPDTPAT
jgi:hypothetical protein